MKDVRLFFAGNWVMLLAVVVLQKQLFLIPGTSNAKLVLLSLRVFRLRLFDCGRLLRWRTETSLDGSEQRGVLKFYYCEKHSQRWRTIVIY
jgi:hypothetical protein